MSNPNVRCFEGVRFGLDLGYSMPLVEKTNFRRLLESHGGIVDLIFSEQSDCLVVTEDKIKGNLTYKIEKARKLFKPVVTNKYIVDCVSNGRSVDSEVMALDGHVNPPRPGRSVEVAAAEDVVLPSIQFAVAAIQCLLAAPDFIPRASVDKLKRPVWMPHLTSLFANSAPNVSMEADFAEPEVDANGPFSLDKLRVEREVALAAQMEALALEKTEKERAFMLKEAQRRELEQSSLEEEKAFDLQQEKESLLREARAAQIPSPQMLNPRIPSRAPRSISKDNLPKRVETPHVPVGWSRPVGVPASGKLPVSRDGWTTLTSATKPNKKDAIKVVSVRPSPPPKAERPAKPPTDVGLKIFIGGVKFDDITEKAKVEGWNEARTAKVKADRALEIKKMVEKFGLVNSWQEGWADGYGFATFATKSDAERAVKTLSQFDHRKGLCKQVRARLIAEMKEKLIAPKASFYVRWPKFYQKIVDRNEAKKSKELAEKQQAKEEKDRAEKEQRLHDSFAVIG